MRRQCPFIFLARPTESPFNGTTGIFNESSISLFFNLVIFPTVMEVFIESINISLGFRSSTFDFVSSPNISGKRVYFRFNFSTISGRLPVFDATQPERVSVFVRMLSSSVSNASEPPGSAFRIG